MKFACFRCSFIPRNVEVIAIAGLVIGRQNFDTNDWISFRDASLPGLITVIRYWPASLLRENTVVHNII